MKKKSFAFIYVKHIFDPLKGKMIKTKKNLGRSTVRKEQQHYNIINSFINTETLARSY